MDSWSHFVADRDLDRGEQSSNDSCFRRVPTNTAITAQQNKFEPSIDAAILRTLSSSPLQGMSRNPSDTSVGCIRVQNSFDAAFRATETSAIPRRNLTEAFEELYIEPPPEADTPLVKQTKEATMISPTGVTELDHELTNASSETPHIQSNFVTPDKTAVKMALPHFELHQELQRDLSDALVDRVSFYAVIHDINKEATAMASNDESGYQRNPEGLQEEYDPLVVAVNGYPREPLVTADSTVDFALIDEERWLLGAIDSRSVDESRSIKACPPTFLQAMGERDYENPLTSLSNGSRTQLWKPSRSWWEAKSGKNPWIEPKSHSKRWRYLWPLIHYHKFLARCIKKLKRNNVDVKTSVSPVSVFLREEVCAISDHLAAVSLFDSDEWMNCLHYFTGWTDTDPEAEERIRTLVSGMKLRPLAEPGDIDSPLLRSQIDEVYLRAMATARAQMAGTGNDNDRRSNKDQSGRSIQQTSDGKAKKNSSSQSPSGHPPVYPRGVSSPPSYHVPAHINGANSASISRATWGYPQQPPHWWGNGWHPHGPYHHYGDDTSVQSGLSGDSFLPPYDMSLYPGAMHHPHYFHPMMYPQHQLAPGQQPAYEHMVQGPHAFGMDGVGWSNGGHINSHTSGSPTQPVTPSTGHQIQDKSIPEYPKEAVSMDKPTPTTQITDEQSPYKYNPASPYWGHLDQTTLAMMGIATPQGNSTPEAPSRGMQSSTDSNSNGQSGEDVHAAAVNAQPLLLRQHYPSYGYYSNSEGYGPPSPATQFMMSPQANFAYGYGGYGTYSPSHRNSPPKAAESSTNIADKTSTTPPSKTERGSSSGPEVVTSEEPSPQ